MGQHYDENGETEWACGGDGDCDAVQAEPDCVSGYSHRWTGQGCGGCDGDPGVWSLGGTAYRYEARCLVCGVRRTEVHHGSQRDPGECDEVSYETGDADADEVAAEMRHQDRNRRRRLARRRAKVEATQRARRRIQRARDYLSIIGEVGSGTVYRDDAVDGYYVASAPELEPAYRNLAPVRLKAKQSYLDLLGDGCHAVHGPSRCVRLLRGDSIARRPTSSAAGGRFEDPGR